MGSTTRVTRIHDARAAVEYELRGRAGSEKHRTHTEQGTTRGIAESSDLPTAEAYAEYCHQLAQERRRKVEAISITQSFPQEQFDARKPEDAQAVNALGMELAREVAPNSPANVYTHGDGEGGMAHNHIKLANHDLSTGKALRIRAAHWEIAQANDRVMERHGLGTVRAGQSRERGAYWERQRGGDEVAARRQALRDKAREAIQDPRSKDTASLQEVLKERGVELTERAYTIKPSKDGTKPGRTSYGWTYSEAEGTQPAGAKPLRAKSSALSPDVTHRGVHRAFEEKARAKTAKPRSASERAKAALRRSQERGRSHGLER